MKKFLNRMSAAGCDRAGNIFALLAFIGMLASAGSSLAYGFTGIETLRTAISSSFGLMVAGLGLMIPFYEAGHRKNQNYGR